MSQSPDAPARGQWLTRLQILLPFLGLWVLFRGHWLDDAFITFRYARNLAHGLGPVFNPGEAVEGYTSFLWMLLTAVPFTVLSDALALHAVEAISFALGGFLLLRLLDFPGPNDWPGLRLLTVVLLPAPIFVINVADGMETPLLMVLLMESARALLRPPGPRSGALLGVLTAATVLTRPEALPLLAVWPAWMLLLRRPSVGRVGRWLAGFAAAGLPPLLAHEAWRIAFYGEPWPNTFYAKATGALAPRLEAGLEALGRLVFEGTGGPLPPVWLWIGLVLAVVGLRALWRDPRPERRLWLAALWTPVGFRVAFELWSGGEAMGTFRFLAPALPPLFVLADESARELFARRGPPGESEQERATNPGARWGGPAGLVLVIVGALSAGVATLHFLEQRKPYRDGLANAHIALGRWLAETRPPGTWLAIGDAGAVPFYSGLPVIDLWGLNDATIARMPGEYGRREGVADYALGRRPGLVVLWNLTPIRGEREGRADRGGERGGEVLRVLGAQPFDREIAEHPAFRRDYRFVREFVFREASGGRPGGYYLDVFERRPRAAPPDAARGERASPH